MLLQQVQVSKPNRALVLPVTATVTFPDALRLNDEGIVVPHGLRETLLLRHQGFPVPNPMLCYYDWRGTVPFEVQRKTCDLITSHTRAYVLNDMGTGKTRAVLFGWDWLYQNGWAKKLLVVCKISNMNFTWAAEVFGVMPDRKVEILYGSKQKRLEALSRDADIYIVNHDGVTSIADELLLRTDIDTLALDELACYRNNSDRSKLMRKFAERFQWVWGMTGEPMPNAPTDVWGQCKIITPKSVPHRFTVARTMLMTNIDGGKGWKWLPKDNAVEQAFNMMQPAVRFALDDVVELPEVVHRTIDVEMTPAAAAVYKKLAKEFQVMFENKQITAVNAAAAMVKLLQVSLGRVYTVAPEYLDLDSTPRKEALLELIEESSHKVLVFAPYRHVVDDLHEFLTTKTIEHTVVTGDTPQKERDTEFNLFQNTAKYKVLLAHPQCLAHGLTLTAANTIIWYGPTPSLEIYDQANARIRRVGQKNRQQILHLQSTPVEKKIYRLLLAKQSVQDKLLEMFEQQTERRS